MRWHIQLRGEKSLILAFHSSWTDVLISFLASKAARRAKGEKLTKSDSAAVAPNWFHSNVTLRRWGLYVLCPSLKEQEKRRMGSSLSSSRLCSRCFMNPVSWPLLRISRNLLRINMHFRVFTAAKQALCLKRGHMGHIYAQDSRVELARFSPVLSPPSPTQGLNSQSWKYSVLQSSVLFSPFSPSTH